MKHVTAVKHLEFKNRDGDEGISSAPSRYWKSLTNSEKVVCGTIIALPILWIVGIYLFLPSLIFAGIAYHDIRKHGSVRLKKPNIVTISLCSFATYRLVGGLFFDLANHDPTDIVALVRGLILVWYPVLLLLWYIESNDIRVRPDKVGTSLIPLTLSMLVFWLVVQFGLGGPNYVYPNTIYSIAIGNASGPYEAGKGLSNYLIPYRVSDVGFGPFSRWSFYFIIPELSGLIASAIFILALDLKNRAITAYLLPVSILFLLLSGTRSCWLGLPIVLIIRWTYAVSKKKTAAIPFVLIALLSFTIFTFPNVMVALSDLSQTQVEALGEVREDSTSVREDIYRETLERLPDRPLFGHWKAGPTVLPGFDLARIGSHSFILGTLLYRLGLAGTLLFAIFWSSLFYWLCKTSNGRPLAGFLILVLYTLLSPVMEYGEIMAHMLILLVIVLRDPTNDQATKPTRGNSMSKYFI
jgi:hypothetical protein